MTTMMRRAMVEDVTTFVKKNKLKIVGGIVGGALAVAGIIKVIVTKVKKK